MREAAKPNWLVFADDWGRHPSSCQYLMRELLNRVNVTWVDTIGMRTPRLDLATVRRVIGKIRASLASSTDSTKAESAWNTGLAVEPTVLRPAMWPWFTRPHDRKLNRSILLRKLQPVVESWPQPRVLVTTIPIVADIVDQLSIDRCIYYCVDDFSAWPGLDQKTMLAMEDRLLENVDLVVASSKVLQARLEDRVSSIDLLTHGVDLKMWQCSRPTYDWPSAVSAVSSLAPILFWGVIDPRLDVGFVSAAAKACGERAIVFVGPQQNPHREILGLPNVVVLPAVSPTELACMAKSSACLIMPYNDSDLTRAMQPLKLKEYLATGRPVVARTLPSTVEWSDACDLAATPEEFAYAVLGRIRDDVPQSQLAARDRLSTESWASKADAFLQLVNAS